MYENSDQIVSRCKEILNRGDSSFDEFDVTLMLCLSVGLLMFTRARKGIPRGDSKNICWDSCDNDEKASRLRNSIAHGKFEMLDIGQTGQITHILFLGMHEPIELSIEEFRTFMVRYADSYLQNR